MTSRRVIAPMKASTTDAAPVVVSGPVGGLVDKLVEEEVMACNRTGATAVGAYPRPVRSVRYVWRSRRARGEGVPIDRTVNPRAVIHRQAISIALAVVPFGIVFGVTCAQAGLRWTAALGFSSLVFTGSAQFAAVSVLRDGGTVAAAIAAGAFLNVRSLAFGVVMAPALDGPWWKRAAMSQVMIDEAMAVGTVHDDKRWRRYGYLAGGLGVFVTWNVATIVGAVAVSSAGSLVSRAGIDATIPAAFLALLWPRLRDREQLPIAFVGAAIALILVPISPPGIPIVAAALAVLVPTARNNRMRANDAAVVVSDVSAAGPAVGDGR